MEDPQYQSVVLMLDLPPSSLGGIDLLSFTTTPRFQGIKHLPPGWHFAFVSPSASLSVRQGAWFHVTDEAASSSEPSSSFTPGPLELFVKKWDAETETFVAETDEAEILKWRANMGSIWRDGLSPYRQSAGRAGSKGKGVAGDAAAERKADEEDAADEEDDRRDWLRLTRHISAELLERITNGHGKTENHWALTSASSAKRDTDEIPGLQNVYGDTGPLAEKELRFLPIDLKQTWATGITGRERTLAARDRSWALGDLVTSYCHGDEDMVLGELEFTFLMLLTLNNYSCLEQWKRLLELLFTCRQAVIDRSDLFVSAIQLLKLQLEHCEDAEGSLFDLSDEGAPFLKKLLKKFKKNLEEFDANGTEKADVLDELQELEDYLKSQYGWQLDEFLARRGILELEDGEQVDMDVGGFEEEDESGEYAPTFVELTSAQMKALSGTTPPNEEEGEEADSDEDMQLEEDDRTLEEMDARY